MANGTSQSDLREQLKRAQSEKQAIEQQQEAIKEGTKKGCLILIGVSLVGSWIMSAAVMHEAPSEIKSMTFWMFFLAYSVIGCICLFISMRKRQNELEEKSYSACSEVRRIERECEKLDAQEQLAEGERIQGELESQLKEKENHLSYLRSFCELFSCLGVRNTSAIIDPATEDVTSAQDVLSAKKSQNATLRNKIR